MGMLKDDGLKESAALWNVSGRHRPPLDRPPFGNVDFFDFVESKHRH